MNWKTVEALPTGDEKAVMFGTLKEHKGGGMTANNKPFAKVSITDETGVTKNCKLYGTLPVVTDVGKRLQFTVGWYDYTYQGKSGRAFSGFWNDKAVVNHSAPRAKPEPTYQKAEDKPDWDKIAEGKVLHGIICSAIQSGQMECKTLNDVRSYLDLIMGRIELPGSIKDVVKQVESYPNPEENPNLDDQSIPF